MVGAFAANINHEILNRKIGVRRLRVFDRSLVLQSVGVPTPELEDLILAGGTIEDHSVVLSLVPILEKEPSGSSIASLQRKPDNRNTTFIFYERNGLRLDRMDFFQC